MVTKPTACHVGGLVSITQIADNVRACRSCALRSKAKQPVPGAGSPSDIMVVGQAPGWEEDRDGSCWIGQAGEFLTAALEYHGLDTRRIYFTNLVKCYPGRVKGKGDNAPPPFAIEACRNHLEAEIEAVNPRIIVAVGAIASRILGVSDGIRIAAGKRYVRVLGGSERTIFPVLHPAGLMRRPEDTPQFVTQLAGLTPRVQGVSDAIAIDTETEGDTVWCTALSDGHKVTAFRGGQVSNQGLFVMHNAKFDLVKLQLDLPDWRDTILEAHFLGYKPLKLTDLAATFTGTTLDKSPLKGKEGKRPFSERAETILQMCANDAKVTALLHAQFGPVVEAKWPELYARERKITRVLADMEQRGLPVDQSKLQAARTHLQQMVSEAEATLLRHGITEPSKDDPIKQKFWRGKKKLVTTKTGELSTAAAVLKEHASPDQTEWVDALIAWRQARKFTSTYIAAWEGRERIHPSFNQTGTVTWRFSCSDPNLQNVPKTTGIPLYNLFVAPAGHTFISADYSQVELRVLANLSGDRAMTEAYLGGRDLHSETVARLDAAGLFARYGITHPDHKRRFAKTINFGIAYGITAYGLTPRLKVSEQAAESFIRGFYDAYPTIASWQAEQVAQSKRYGYVKTFEGRYLYTPCSLATRGILASHGEKQAVNYPVQGGAMEVIKKAMLRAPEYMVCQVHDELLYMVPDAQVADYTTFLKETLVDNTHTVPYTVDIHTGKSWGELKNIQDIWEDDVEQD